MMSATPQLPIHDIPSQKFSSPVPILANGVESVDMPINEGDDRSSSLSDIEDRTANTELGRTSRTIRDGSEANDTEAETERLEDSPQKVRKHTNVVVSSLNGVYHESEDAIEHDMLSTNDSRDRSKAPRVPNRGDFARDMDINDPRLEQTSEISSLEDSSEEIEGSAPSFNSSSRKRKRKSPQSNSLTEDERAEMVSMKKTQSPLSQGHLHSNVADKGPKAEKLLAEDDLNSGTDKRKYTEFEAEVASSQNPSPSKSKSKKGKRKAKKTKDEDVDHSNLAISYTDNQVEHFDNIEQVDSNGEDVEMEDIGDGPEADMAARTEEGRECFPIYESRSPTWFLVGQKSTNVFVVVKKRSAMESLSAIEKCFATLRDK